MDKLREILQEFSNIGGVKAALVFGSTYFQNQRDTDILLVLDSKDFQTDGEAYVKISEVLQKNSRFYPPFDVVIKSSAEFENPNVVSLSFGFLQHLSNILPVAKARDYLIDNMNLENLIKERLSEIRLIGGYWNIIGDSLSVRQECLKKELGEDYKISFSLWQQAVRELFRMEFNIQFEGKEGIASLFYNKLNTLLGNEFLNLFDASPEYMANEIIQIINRGDVYGLKDEIEKAMFALNLYLVSKESSNLNFSKSLSRAMLR